MNEKLSANRPVPAPLPHAQAVVHTPVAAEYTDYAEDTVDLREILAVLRRHLWMILSVAVLTAGAVAALVYTQPPEYRAGAILRLKDVRGALTAGLGDADLQGALMGRMTDPLLSEIEVLKSPAVAQAVVDREGLRLQVPYEDVPLSLLRAVQIDSAFPADTLQVKFSASRVVAQGRSGTATAPYGEPLRFGGLQFAVASRPEVDEAEFIVLSRARAVQDFLEKLQATPREQTNVVDVTYTAVDPEVAQRVVNTAVSTFQEVNTNMAQQQSRRRRAFVEEQLQQTDSVLSHAQLAMSGFRRRQQVYSSSQQFAAEQGTLRELDLQREEMDAEGRMYESLLSSIQRSRSADGGDGLRALASSPAVASNPVIGQLYARLLQYQVSLDSMTTGRFASSANNPDVEQLSSLIASTRTALVASLRGHIEAGRARIVALDRLRGRSAVQMAVLPDAEAEEVRLALQLETTKQIADQLRQEYQKARVAEVAEGGQVELLALAPMPEEPIRQHRSLKVALGLLVGLVLGSGGAFLREQMNTALSRREEVEAALRAPTLGVIPEIVPVSHEAHSRLLGRGTARQNGKRETRLITAENANSSGAEAYRSLRTNLMFSQVVQSLRTIVVTSSSPGEGKTTTAANLAVAFAQQGMRVLLVDCDLRRPRVHTVFNFPMEPGLTNLVLGKADDLEGVVHASAVDGLAVLTAGVLPPNPSELLGSARMRETLERLTADFDLVVIDTPPVLAAADAAVLAAWVDGVLVVVRAGQTERAAAQHTAQQLGAVGARILGAVLNDPDTKLPQYGGYYGYHAEYSYAAKG